MITPLSCIPVSGCCSARRGNVAKKTNNTPSFGMTDVPKGFFHTGFFRRGIHFSPLNWDFTHIQDALRRVYSKVEKPNILMVRVDDAQDAFSYLAQIKDMFPDKPLHSVVNMNFVDLREPISDSLLYKFSQLPDGVEPEFAKNSFDAYYSPRADNRLAYQAKSELYNYLVNAFLDKSKAKFNTRIEDISSQYPSNHFHLISINNALQFMEREPALRTMNDMDRMLTNDGIIITDPFDVAYREAFSHLNYYKHLNPGIWQKP